MPDRFDQRYSFSHTVFYGGTQQGLAEAITNTIRDALDKGRKAFPADKQGAIRIVSIAPSVCPFNGQAVDVDGNEMPRDGHTYYIVASVVLEVVTRTLPTTPDELDSERADLKERFADLFAGLRKAAREGGNGGQK